MVAIGNKNGEDDLDVTIDMDVSEFTDAMQEAGAALAQIAEILGELWRTAADSLVTAFASLYCLDPGGPYSARQGEAIHTEADALTVVDHASRTVMWPGKRMPKRHRRYAKARYLACRRILGAEGVRGVPVNQFLST